MNIQSQFNKTAIKPTLASVLNNNNEKLALNMMCCRIGIVEKFYSEDLTADILLVNKKTLGINKDGSQVVRDWALIRAKICYCTPFETFPIQKGDECLILFSDREIESWFINGGTNTISHSRMHDATDAIAIVGLRSIPKMIQIMNEALHLFYGNSNLILSENEINLNTDTVNISGTNINISGELTINGQKYVEHTHSNGNQGNPTGTVIQ